MPRDPEKPDVFRRAHELALEVYRVTERLPEAERFGLQAQLRHAGVSVPTNLVVGCVRRSARDYARFVDIALGSVVEVRYLLDLTVALGMLSVRDTSRCCDRSDHVVRALKNLQRAVGGFAE